MYEIQVNVGLNVSEKFPVLRELYGENVHQFVVLDALFDAMRYYNAYRGLRGIAHRLDHSDTEPTLVVRLRFETEADIGYFLAGLHVFKHRAVSSIGQDCIAVYRPEVGVGVLIGEYADSWGTFNKDYFIEF